MEQIVSMIVVVVATIGAVVSYLKFDPGYYQREDVRK